MNSSILNAIIMSMAKTRPVFFSEADFQHSLAIELKTRGYAVYLEYPLVINSKEYHIDIVVEDQGLLYPIELKFKTNAATCAGLFCDIILKNHGAHDINRFLFWKDVDRIELLKRVFEKKISEGYVIMLSNDDNYWNVPQKTTRKDQMFLLHPMQIVQCISWVNTLNAPNYQTKKATYLSFHLKNAYRIPDWLPYSKAFDINHNPTQEFRFLTLTI